MPHPQVDTLEESLRHERRSAAEKEARNKLNVDRLRRQIADLQVRVCSTARPKLDTCHAACSPAPAAI